MEAFIKTIGHAGMSVPPDWMREADWSARLQHVLFPKNPRSLKRGTRIVYYAAGTRRFCAVLVVIDDEARANTEATADRWPFKLNVRPLVAIPADEHAPSLEDVGINPLSIRRQSHIRITERQYDAIVAGILAAATTAASAG
jgi:hypothetical protein